MVVLEIVAISQFKRFKKSRFGKATINTLKQIDPDRNMQRILRRKNANVYDKR